MKKLLSLASARHLRLALIGVPWVLAAIYLLLFAADRYVAESVIAVRQNGDGPIAVDSLTSLFTAATPTTREDELMLEAHILSMDMLRQLEEKLGLREHFSSPLADVVFRLDEDATQEEMLAYYRDRIEVIVDDRSGLIRVRTQGFTPELAEAMNREVIAISERFINESSHRLAREQMAFAESELAKARKAVNSARDRVLAFQEEKGVLDPVAQAMAATGLTAELQATLARQEAELKGLLGYLNEQAHQIKGLRIQIAGTRSQLDAENRRATQGAQGAGLNVLAGVYQELLADLQFTQDTYKLALTGLESARIESTRKLKSLVLVESPARPQSAEYPRRAYTLLALLMGLTLLYGIARLVVATIQDHQE